jgi:hypothetical protein
MTALNTRIAALGTRTVGGDETVAVSSMPRPGSMHEYHWGNFTPARRERSAAEDVHLVSAARLFQAE